QLVENSAVKSSLGANHYAVKDLRAKFRCIGFVLDTGNDQKWLGHKPDLISVKSRGRLPAGGNVDHEDRVQEIARLQHRLVDLQGRDTELESRLLDHAKSIRETPGEPWKPILL